MPTAITNIVPVPSITCEIGERERGGERQISHIHVHAYMYSRCRFQTHYLHVHVHYNWNHTCSNCCKNVIQEEEHNVHVHSSRQCESNLVYMKDVINTMCIATVSTNTQREAHRHVHCHIYAHVNYQVASNTLHTFYIFTSILSSPEVFIITVVSHKSS